MLQGYVGFPLENQNHLLMLGLNTSSASIVGLLKNRETSCWIQQVSWSNAVDGVPTFLAYQEFLGGFPR